jgi:nucleoside-diphosphate-sugar epimerase
MTGVVFVAGASGVIGRRLCRLLVADGWKVTGTTRAQEKAAALATLGVEPAIVDVFDAAGLSDAVARSKANVVVHQLTDLSGVTDAAQLAEARVRNARIREIGTRHLVAASVANGVARLVAQSIAFAYAPGPKPYLEDAPLNVADPARGVTARGVASLEQQVCAAPLVAIVLRYGRLYGPDTGSDAPPKGGPLHVDAAADAARRAISHGAAGIYNVAEDDGAVSSQKARQEFGWSADFRLV